MKRLLKGIFLTSALLSSASLLLRNTQPKGNKLTEIRMIMKRNNNTRLNHKPLWVSSTKSQLHQAIDAVFWAIPIYLKLQLSQKILFLRYSAIRKTQVD
jgi:hypothetical protein